MIPEKAEQARKNIERAGLSKFVEIRTGDALDTLKNLDQPIDFLLNDGFPLAALHVLKLVQPKLRKGAVVLTDNVGLFKADYKSYTDYIRNSENGFVSGNIKINEGTEFSVKQ